MKNIKTEQIKVNMAPYNFIRGYRYRPSEHKEPYFTLIVDRLADMLEEYANQFKPEWVSVEERLPDCKGDYLAISTLTTKIVLAECYDAIIDEKTLGLKFQDYITHWMPLPEPPQVLTNR